MFQPLTEPSTLRALAEANFAKYLTNLFEKLHPPWTNVNIEH